MILDLFLIFFTYKVHVIFSSDLPQPRFDSSFFYHRFTISELWFFLCSNKSLPLRFPLPPLGFLVVEAAGAVLLDEVEGSIGTTAVVVTAVVEAVVGGVCPFTQGVPSSGSIEQLKGQSKLNLDMRSPHPDLTSSQRLRHGFNTILRSSIHNGT